MIDTEYYGAYCIVATVLDWNCQWSSSEELKIIDGTCSMADSSFFLNKIAKGAENKNTQTNQVANTQTVSPPMAPK